MDDMQNKITSILNDPNAMAKITDMAKSLRGGDTPPTAETTALAPTGQSGDIMGLLGGLDPKLLGHITRIFGEYMRPDDERTHLLHALKPYMREGRREKMDQAVNIIKLAHTARIALEALNGR